MTTVGQVRVRLAISRIRRTTPGSRSSSVRRGPTANNANAARSSACRKGRLALAEAPWPRVGRDHAVTRFENRDLLVPHAVVQKAAV